MRIMKVPIVVWNREYLCLLRAAVQMHASMLMGLRKDNQCFVYSVVYAV
jgi:hypothetical protein